MLTNLPTIVKASHTGMVDSLFVPTGNPQLETPGGNSVKDLETKGMLELDAAIMYTLIHSGRIYTMEPGALPGGSPAAMLRFAAWQGS